MVVGNMCGGRNIPYHTFICSIHCCWDRRQVGIKAYLCSENTYSTLHVFSLHYKYMYLEKIVYFQVIIYDNKPGVCMYYITIFFYNNSKSNNNVYLLMAVCVMFLRVFLKNFVLCRVSIPSYQHMFPLYT